MFSFAYGIVWMRAMYMFLFAYGIVQIRGMYMFLFEYSIVQYGCLFAYDIVQMFIAYGIVKMREMYIFICIWYSVDVYLHMVQCGCLFAYGIVWVGGIPRSPSHLSFSVIQSHGRPSGIGPEVEHLRPGRTGLRVRDGSGKNRAHHHHPLSLSPLLLPYSSTSAASLTPPQEVIIVVPFTAKHTHISSISTVWLSSHKQLHFFSAKATHSGCPVPHTNMSTLCGDQDLSV